MVQYSEWFVEELKTNRIKGKKKKRKTSIGKDVTNVVGKNLSRVAVLMILSPQDLSVSTSLWPRDCNKSP